MAAESDTGRNNKSALELVRPAIPGTSGIAIGENMKGEIDELARATAAAIRHVMDSRPQRRVARIITNAGLQVKERSDEARRIVGKLIAAFAREAGELMELGDFAGLQSLTLGFQNAVNKASAIAPKRPELMPDVRAFELAGWTSEERDNLAAFLKRSGNRVVAIDKEGAALAGGRKLSRAQIFALSQPRYSDRKFDDRGRSSGAHE
jgi:hypothetical protein